MESLRSIRRISREEYLGRELEYFRTAGGTRPDLALVEVEGRRFIVKDFNGSAPLFRLLIAPALIRRESGALRKLASVSGIPKLVADIDRLAFAIEYVPGRSLDKIGNIELSEEFFETLKETVRQMHSSGVAHCDLRSRGNVIVGDDGRPYIVDFAACVMRGRGLNPFINWLFTRFCEADEISVLKIKYRLARNLLTLEEEESLSKPNALEKPAVFIGRSIRNITRFFLARRK